MSQSCLDWIVMMRLVLLGILKTSPCLIILFPILLTKAFLRPCMIHNINKVLFIIIREKCLPTLGFAVFLLEINLSPVSPLLLSKLFMEDRLYMPVLTMNVYSWAKHIVKYLLNFLKCTSNLCDDVK